MYLCAMCYVMYLRVMSCIYVLWASILLLSTILIFGNRFVPTVWLYFIFHLITIIVSACENYDYMVPLTSRIMILWFPLTSRIMIVWFPLTSRIMIV